MSHAAVASDAVLVEQTRRGSAAAFEALVRRYYRAAHAVALAVCGSSMDAEDACQDAFIRALERIEECRHPEQFAGWLLTIVRNRARNLRDYQQVRAGPSLEGMNAASGADAARDAERSELRERLEAALGELGPLQREVVLLHDLEGWKHREIATALGISEGMARQHLFQARGTLRKRLGARALKEYLHD